MSRRRHPSRLAQNRIASAWAHPRLIIIQAMARACETLVKLWNTQRNPYRLALHHAASPGGFGFRNPSTTFPIRPRPRRPRRSEPGIRPGHPRGISAKTARAFSRQVSKSLRQDLATAGPRFSSGHCAGNPHAELIPSIWKVPRRFGRAMRKRIYKVGQ
jgi:hypothetical protein